MSDSGRSLYQRLSDARSEFGPVVKKNVVKVGTRFSYSYADLATVIEATEPVLRKHGLLCSQTLRDNENGDISVETTLVSLNDGAEGPSSLVTLRPVNKDPQGYGSAITYARRYSLLAILGIAPEDDDGAAAVVPPPEGRNARANAANASPAVQTASRMLSAYFSAHPDEKKVSIREFMVDRDMAVAGESVSAEQVADLIIYLEGIANAAKDEGTLR